MKNIQEMILSECDDFDLKEIDLMMKLLQKKKHQLEKELCLRRNQLMQDFLTNAKSKIHREQKLLAERLEIIEKDLNDLHEQMRAEKNRIIYEPMQKIEIEPEKFEKNTKKPDSSLSSLFNHNLTKSKTDLTKNLLGFDTFGTERQQQQGGKSYAQHNPFELNELFEMQRKKLNLYYDCFEKHYFDQCKREQFNDESLKNVHGKSGRFDRFKKDLNQFVLYSQLRPLASLNYAKDSSNIVSSIEFDKDMEFFAIAGVAKKIKIFDYAGVVKDSLGLSYPINDIDCSSKISCLCWNSYYKAMLATSDYEGNVIIWDAFIGQKLNVFQEHQKRCWSVDFNKIDINLVASGSDDTTVKLWSTNMNMSVITLNSSANICSVKFNPKQMHSLAFASADHCVYYYDLRNTKKPLILFNEHRKAVSYVEFLNENELVSASTDSQIKLWNTNQSTSILTYRGHVNEKNFVGLTSNNDFIACGSENNSLYIYYKSIDKQMLTYSFDKWEKEENNDFVSAVCWRRSSNVILAANSQGLIMILELV
ncbi:F-box/LRR-repeat protein 7 [Sarcoptes scabiei]|nr:F-box/LRR-repeat protein 7 [Sarcoptes scabiei]